MTTTDRVHELRHPVEPTLVGPLTTAALRAHSAELAAGVGCARRALVTPRARRATASFLALALCAGAGPLRAQRAQRVPTPVAVPDEPSCARCAIDVRPLVRLGAADGPGMLDRKPFFVRADRRGRFWITIEGQLPLVYGADGRFLQAVGRAGSGPREFRWAFDVVDLPGDSVLITDARLNRATVVGPDLRPGRMVRMPHQLRNGVVTRWPGAVAANGVVGAAGRALHYVSFGGEEAATVASFGGPSAAPGAGGEGSAWYALAPARAGGVWAAPTYAYELTRWGTDGASLRALARRPDWFAEPSRGTHGGPTTPPSPRVDAIQEDDRGLLWVFVRVAAPTWKAAWGKMRPGQLEIASKDIELEQLYETVIEVIDPSAGRVVARRRIGEWVVGALPDGRAAVYDVDADGVPFVSVVALRLTRR